ncbi:ammonium transporter [Tomitella cavernea]|uniref:Ammonium transporter n=2 Tax=Tomitella cavernea TaxID=1387982 RepID=A0ABP9CSD0_9ACTN
MVRVSKMTGSGWEAVAPDGVVLQALGAGVPDPGNTAWVLISAGLVMLMTPGLAFFYGGMVRARSVLNMIMMSFSALGVVGVLWVLFGFSAVFGDSLGGVIGDPFDFAALGGILPEGAGNAPLVGTIPAAAFVIFQLMFASITVALISGAVADRMKFSAWLVFAGIWAVLVYFPVAHWVFAADGLVSDEGGWIISDLHAIDFAGGTAVHINAGVAALVLATVLGVRRGWRTHPSRPHNLTLVMVGVALLWFGWIGFNSGSALAADGAAASVLVMTIVAACAGMLAWLVVERVRDGHHTTLGAASGVVAGLVGITPACASVDVVGALVIGVASGAACALAVGVKFRLGYDDSLDVVGVHLVGGLIGTLLVGLFATSAAPTGVDGLFYGGGADQLWRQAVGAAAVMAYAAVATTVIALAVRACMGLRVDPEDEIAGIDLSQHAESAYDWGRAAGRQVSGPGHAGIGHSAAESGVRDAEPAAAGQDREYAVTGGRRGPS